MIICKYSVGIAIGDGLREQRLHGSFPFSFFSVILVGIRRLERLATDISRKIIVGWNSRNHSAVSHREKDSSSKSTRKSSAIDLRKSLLKAL